MYLNQKYGKPNFFILGAGKSGTTTLYDLLKKHPEVYMSKVKEPSFYCSYFSVSGINNVFDYHALFSDSENFTCVGDASHVYLSNPESASILNCLYPEAKFIIILRNPTNRAYSLYNHMVKYKLEVIKTFEEAIEQKEERFKSKEFFNNCPQYFWNFMYKRSSLYEKQIENYLKYFKKEQFLVATLNELMEESQNTMNKIFNFLKIKNIKMEKLHSNKSNYDPLNLKVRHNLDKYFLKTLNYVNNIFDINLTNKSL